MVIKDNEVGGLRIPPQNLTDALDQTKAETKAGSGWLSLGALTAIVLLAAGLRLINLSSLGLANHYYAAAVKSMLESWHNFFFVAAEPGGSVSVDKPPVGLWLQAISAKIFGITTFSLLLPQLLAGLFSVILIYYLVKRKFGLPAGLIAALVMAITPVLVATDRNNTMDSMLVFTLLLAAWAFIKATETTRLRYLVVGAILIGISFNIKMLEAYLSLPALLALYFLGAREEWYRKIGKLSLVAIILLVVSFSWAVAVDLTPADQRPYVGSSGDNSEISLILGYNGIERLLGIFGGRAGGSIARPNNLGLNPPNGSVFPLDRGSPTNNIQMGPPNNPNRGQIPSGLAPGGATSGIGQAGALRLFIPPLNKETSWLLPIALSSLLLLLVAHRLTWPLVGQHQAVVLWGGWLITAGIFFSIAGFFHEYYLSTLAPPMAALVGIGLVEIWRLRRKYLWLAGASIVALSALTLLLQYNIARAFLRDLPWLPLIVGLFVIGTVIIFAANILRDTDQNSLARIGFSCLVIATLITPGIWSILTNLHPSSNQSLPAAYDGSSNGPANSGRIQIDIPLLNYLQANTHGVYYLMAVPSSMQGADYVLATSRPVLYLGGFMGQDEVLTPESLASLVADGKLRYIYWNAQIDGSGGSAPIGGQALVTTWVSSHCNIVQGFNTITRNFGAPDGINGGIGNGGFIGGAHPMVLYECGN